MPIQSLVKSSVRTRITTVMLLMTLVPTLIVGALGYWTASGVIEQERIRSVGVMADMKKELLVFRLTRQNERDKELLAAIDTACLRGGRIATDCARTLLKSYVMTEFILDARLTLPNGSVLTEGDNAADLVEQAPRRKGQLASFSRRDIERPNYVISARENRMSILTRHDATAIEENFANGRSLGVSGETFLADAEGRFLTSPKYHSHTSASHPIEAAPMKACLLPSNGEMLADDYRQAPVIHGFRFVPEIGGGCIMAHVQQDEAFLPLRHLRNQVLALVLLFACAAIVISFFVSRGFSRQFTDPLRQLVDRIAAARSGDLDTPVPTGGPKEIAVLGQGFSELAAQLKKNIEVREDFVSIVSHDLKNPLNALGISLAVMERTLSGESTESKSALSRQISLMRQLLAKMAEMINSVLSLTAIRSGHFVLKPEIHDLKALVTTAIDSIRPMAVERGIELTIDCAKTEMVACVDPGRIAQVLANLLGNALKFTPPDGKITIEISEGKAGVRVGVMDTGPGISEENLEQIFERFSQVQLAQKSREFSVGLGLYIAKEIVLAHGGRIWAESRLGQGAKFYFELPTTCRENGLSTDSPTQKPREQRQDDAQ